MVSYAPASAGELLEQNIREQRGGLDVAPRPTRVGGGHRRYALFEQLWRERLQRRGKGEQSRLQSRPQA